MNKEEIIKQWRKFLRYCYENNDKTVEIHRDNLEYIINYISNLESKIEKSEIEKVEQKTIRTLSDTDKGDVHLGLQK